jgi:hypothetical protein
MKLVIRTVIFHLSCITLFTFVYLYMEDQFDFNFKTNNQAKGFLDCFMLSTTIQCGNGYSDLFPLTYYSKLAVIIQQFLMMMTHIITLYVFTL